MIGLFRADARNYGVSVAWFNLRFTLAYTVAKALIRRPIRLSVK